MRSFHVIFLLIVILLTLIVSEDGNTFTVIRPRQSVIRTRTLPPGTPTSTIPPATPAPTGVVTQPTHVSHPGGTKKPPSVTPTQVSPSFSPSPTPESLRRSKFPTFILGVSLVTVLLVILWYFTRNVNFRRLFR